MDSDTPIQQMSGIDNYIGSIFSVLLTLAVIVILIVLFVRLLSRKNKLWQMNQSIRTLGGTGLGPNKSLQVVEVGEVVYVLGVGEDITLIDKVSDPDQVAILMATFERTNSSQAAWPSSITNWLKQWNEKRHSRSNETLDQDTDSSSVSFHEMFHTKLDQMPDRKARVEQLLKDDTKEDR